jgi:CBS domain-containing protein
LHHQARRIKNGAPADNFVAPEELSHFELNHLKDAFAIVRLMQSSMAQRYQTAHLS